MEILLWLAGLFASAFLSATLLPGNSEATLAAALHFKPSLGLLAVAVASLGNVLGGLLTVWLGRKIPPAPQKPWLQCLQSLGPVSLLFSWLPIVGDALCGVAGWLRWSWLPVIFYLSIGKILRYLAIYFWLNP
ncbi:MULTISPECIES: YqaA family protein [Deefgea]|uniref:DedA family protein n=1 Tax=Deefgea chitinilytica TaxID=570276 RepID=A0ABS2CB01_9NEIS|nr:MULTISPECIES: DedA family protein [Deefgea]MBM5571334.1 DedA family protein [Deefgea chitinilytica]MBM9888567.1 DedA family protein [Deefgea sp. CFH1-16]